MKNYQLDNILAVVILYGEKLWDCNTYKTLLSQYSELSLFIYDNSPQTQHVYTEFDENVKYVSDPTNPGLSYAYNRAVQYAIRQNYNWILILDQDTHFPTGILSEYLTAINENPEIKLFVPPMQIDGGKYISPVKVHFHSASPSKLVPSGIASIKKYSPINSGMMIDVDAFLNVGGYNVRVQLDFSDYQFIERFARYYDTFYVLKSICRQEFSNQKQTAEQKLYRFGIFCDCLRNCEKRGRMDEAYYFYVVSKRALSLTIRLFSFQPLLILLKYFK